MDIIVEKDGIKWILKGASFTANGLVYEEAMPLELQTLLEEKEQIEEMIASQNITDEELLEWAREHHPNIIEIRRLQEKLDEIEERIQELQSLSFEE